MLCMVIIDKNLLLIIMNNFNKNVRKLRCFRAFFAANSLDVIIKCDNRFVTKHFKSLSLVLCTGS